MIQAVRALDSRLVTSSLALRRSAPAGAASARIAKTALPSNQSVYPSPDRLHKGLAAGRVPAAGIRFDFAAPLQASQGPSLHSSDPENIFATQLQKLQHVAPAIESLPDFKVTPLKIAIEKDQTQVTLGVHQATLHVTPAGESRQLTEISGELTAEAQTQGHLLLRLNGTELGIFKADLQMTHDNESLRINGNDFRGDLRLVPAAEGRFHVVNDVLLEDYLKSVVPSESPASWPQQSLQAQALAARTYAVANWGKNKDAGFDMNDDTSDQVYKGVSTEHPATQEAVAATRGQIITHGNKPITALFFSASGGHTDSSKEVWGVELPYIQPVPDFDQAASRYRWSLSRNQQELQAAVQALGHDVGTIRHIEGVDYTAHERVKRLKITGSRGSVTVDGNRFRFAAKLYSTKFKVTANGNGFKFEGGGWGHALGMSQWGARQMAKDGYNAAEIVKHYYTGVDIQSLDE